MSVVEKTIYTNNEARMKDIKTKCTSGGYMCTSFGGTGSEADPLFATFTREISSNEAQ